MNMNEHTQIRIAESVLHEKFVTEPFHSLYHLYGLANTQNLDLSYGGTCSDKALSYIQALQKEHITAGIHSACIGGKPIHRVVRIVINEQVYFADPGNGWPAIKLYPAFCSSMFQCFGMTFRSKLIRNQAKGDMLIVYHNKNGQEKEQMRINTTPQSQQQIEQQIHDRFKPDKLYPFSHKLRFSRVKGEQFLFLRGGELSIYSAFQATKKHPVNTNNLQQVIKTHFQFDIRPILEVATHQSGALP